jgi:hypothetical protein
MQPGQDQRPAPAQPQDRAVIIEPLRLERPTVGHLHQAPVVRGKIDALGKLPCTSRSDHLTVRADEHARAATAADFRLPALAQPRRALELVDSQLELVDQHHRFGRAGRERPKGVLDQRRAHPSAA